jgi:hypothetical protein
MKTVNGQESGTEGGQVCNSMHIMSKQDMSKQDWSGGLRVAASEDCPLVTRYLFQSPQYLRHLFCKAVAP